MLVLGYGVYCESESINIEVKQESRFGNRMLSSSNGSCAKRSVGLMQCLLQLSMLNGNYSTLITVKHALMHTQLYTLSRFYA